MLLYFNLSEIQRDTGKKVCLHCTTLVLESKCIRIVKNVVDRFFFIQCRSEPLASFKLPQFLQQNIWPDLKGVIQLLLKAY